MAEELPLTGVREGERVVVARYCGEAAERLRELGLTVGTELVVRRRVGVGRVLEVEFRQLRLGMRLSEAACIYVRRC
jgi:Fe2+ transport system protein FeoA